MDRFFSRRFILPAILAICLSLFSVCDDVTLPENLPEGIAEISPFSEGRAAFRVGSQWGYIDEQFRVIIPAQFAAARPFSSGHAAVKLTRKWGFIDKSGNYIINPHYSDAREFRENLAPVREGGSWSYTDMSGKVIIDPQFEEVLPFSEGLSAVRVGSRWGYIDPHGHFVINPLFRHGGPFSEKLAPVQTEGLDDEWGFIDHSGKFAIPAAFDEAKPFSGGLAAVRIDTKWGFIDRKGKIIINPRFSDAGSFSNGTARVRENNKWGYINRRGKFVIEPQFDDVRDFYKGFALAVKDGISGFINTSGTMKLKVPAITGSAMTRAAASASTLASGSATVTVALSDYLKKAPVPEARIYLLGEKGRSINAYGVTDAGGNASFALQKYDLDDFKGIYVLRSGYWEKFARWGEGRKNNNNLTFTLTTFRRDTPFPGLAKARLKSVNGVEEYDILTEPVDFIQFRPDKVNITLTADTHGWNITGYRLQQGTVYLRSNDPVFKDVAIGRTFSPGKPIYGVVETDYGDLCGFVPLRIRVRENPNIKNPLPTVPASESFNVAGNVPIFNKFTGGLNIPFFPVSAFYEQDKLTLILGIQGAWENGDVLTPRSLVNDMKKNFADVGKARKFLRDKKGSFKNMGPSGFWDASLGMMGYLEMTFDEEGNQHLAGGQALLFGGGSVTVQNQFVIVVVPVFVAGTVGANLSAAFTYEEKMQRIEDFFKSVELTFTPFVEIEAGVGIKGILAVSIAGIGSIPITYQPVRNKFRVDLTLAAEFRATAFVFLTFTTTIAEHTWNLYPHPGILNPAFTAGSTPGSPFDMTSFRAAPRSGETARWVENRQLPPAIGPFREQVMPTIVLPGTEPQLVRFGRREALLWIGDDPKRGNNNRAVLWYSLRNAGGSFSKPKPVHDDGTNDIAFSAVAHKGYLWVAWQNTTKPFLENKELSLKEMCRNSAIYTGWLHDPRIGSSEFRDITNVSAEYKGAYSGRPQIASDGHNLGIAWSINMDFNYFGTTGLNSFRGAVYNSRNKWENIMFNWMDAKPVPSFAAGFDNGSPVVAFVLDNDRNLGTIHDRTLHRVNTNGNAAILENRSLIGHPRIGAFKGRTTVFWYQDNNIRYTSDLHSGRSIHNVFDKKITALSDDYDIMLDPEGSVRGILWVDSGSELKSEAYAGIYNERDGNWGDPIPLTKSGKRVEAPQGYLDKNGSAVLAYRRMEIHTKNQKKEYVPGKSELCIADIEPSVDLVLGEHAIQGNAGPQEPGKLYGFDFRVANHGTVPSEGIKLEVLDRQGRILRTKTFPNRLLPGEAAILQGEYPVPRPLTRHDFSIRVNPARGSHTGTSSHTASYTVGISRVEVTRVLIYRKEGFRVHRVYIQNMNYVPIPNREIQSLYFAIRRQNEFGRWVAMKVDILNRFNPYETKVFEYAEAVNERDPDFYKKNQYYLEAQDRAGMPMNGTTGTSVVGVEINPFRLNVLTPSVNLAEGHTDGSIISSVIVRNNHPTSRRGELLIQLVNSGGAVVQNTSRPVQLNHSSAETYTAHFCVSDAPTRYKIRAVIRNVTLPTSFRLHSAGRAPDTDEAAVVMAR